MKSENFKITTSNISLCENVRNTLLTTVSLFRMRKTKEEIILKFPKSGNYYSGLRFLDDSTVTDAICSGLVSMAINDVLNQKDIMTNNDENISTAQYISSFISKIGGKGMDVIILEGLRQCAVTDYLLAYKTKTINDIN